MDGSKKKNMWWFQYKFFCQEQNHRACKWMWKAKCWFLRWELVSERKKLNAGFLDFVVTLVILLFYFQFCNSEYFAKYLLWSLAISFLILIYRAFCQLLVCLFYVWCTTQMLCIRAFHSEKNHSSNCYLDTVFTSYR